MNEVIDAMFERVVEKDEYVIKQGDDGDNFYVIRECVSSFPSQYFSIKPYHSNYNSKLMYSDKITRWFLPYQW